MTEAPDMRDPRLIGAIDLLRRTGADTVGFRYQDDQEPTLWIAEVGWNVQRLGNGYGKPVPKWEHEGERGHDAAAALHPLTAILRLCSQVLDGASMCVHCQRPAAFDEDFGEVPLNELICWYQWDPENEVFRRGCEGDDGRFQGVGRNDPCPCGSGAKFKKCHGG